MSCLDVMYPAYGHYAPYAPSAPAFINSLQAPAAVTPSHCRDRMDTPRGPDLLSGGPGASSSSSSSASSSSSTASTLSSPATSSYAPSAPRSEEGPKEKPEAPEAEYLSSRCVLFTYYQGDISSVVDQHFSRALSSYMDGEGKRRRPESHGADAPSPSGRRSFPPSFWDSNYPSPQSRPHCDPAPSYPVDPYASGLHPGLSHPHPHAHPHAHPHPPESWAYPQPQYGPPRPLHELYSPSALEPHYGPLLMPAVRPPHLPAMPGHYEVSKLEPSGSWPGLLPPGDVGQSLALNMDTGLPQHKKAKELYWF